MIKFGAVLGLIGILVIIISAVIPNPHNVITDIIKWAEFQQSMSTMQIVGGVSIGLGIVMALIGFIMKIISIQTQYT